MEPARQHSALGKGSQLSIEFSGLALLRRGHDRNGNHRKRRKHHQSHDPDFRHRGRETKTFEPFFDPQLQDHFHYAYSGAFLKDFPDCRPGEAPVAAFRIPEILDRLGNLTATLDFGVSEAALLFLSQSGQ